MTANILLLLVAVAAFLALSAAMPRHQAVLLGRKLSRTESHRARFGGWALLAALFAIAVTLFGGGRGVLVFAGYATLGAAIAVGLQCWRGR
jgi:hypothetical protein